MYVDIKQTIWKRYELSDHITKEQIIEELLNNSDFDYIDNEFLLETAEEMSVEDNGGCATIELYDDEEEELLWSNERQPDEDKPIIDMFKTIQEHFEP